jgi:catechol 2,3-dioxygenase
MSPFNLPPDTHIGHTHLQVSSLDKTRPFYVDLLGFKPIHITEEPDHRFLYLSANGEHPPHIIISERPGAKPAPPNTTGLFHLAIRLPGRKALAQLFQHLITSNYPFQGFSDHGVSEALYLADPEGNGLELYRDRPRNQWPTDGDLIAMRTDPLDVRDLLAEAQDQPTTWAGIHPQTDIGHVHLKVSDLSESEDFYHGVLGLDVTQRTYPGALFFSAGGYHHHIGTNTWASQGGSPPPESSIGLLSFSLRFASGDAWTKLIARIQDSNIEIKKWIDDGHLLSALTKDPFGNGLQLSVDKTQVEE